MKAEAPMDPPTGRLVSRRSFVSSFILLAENLVRLGLVAAVSFWIAHVLGPERFGLLNYASALVMVFWSIALLGLDTPVVARLTHREDQGVVVGSALVLRALAGIVCALAACGAVWIMRPDEPLVILLVAIVSISIPISAPLVIDCWFKAHNEALQPAIARLVATLLSSAAKVGCLMLGFGVVALAWTIALEAILGALALVVAYYGMARGQVRQALRTRRGELVGLLKESWPYALSTAAIAAYMKVDIILLGMLSTNVEVGLYGLCQRLSEVLYILPVIVVDVLYPQLVRHQSAGAAGSLGAPQTFFDLSFAVAIIGTLVAVSAVQWLVPWFFGDAYLRTADLFLVHAFSCIGVAMAHARYKWMAASGLQNLAPVVTLVGLGLAILLNLLLIPSHGAMGAAVATVMAYVGSGYLVSFAFPALRPAAIMQSRSFWPWHRLWREVKRR